MPNIHDDPAALKALQDDIYRERILRARKMTVVQKLRWDRSKDLDDARDVPTTMGPESLDMACIEKRCLPHATTDRLKGAMAGIAPL